MDGASPFGMPLVWALPRWGNASQPRFRRSDVMELDLASGFAFSGRRSFLRAPDETLTRLCAGATVLAICSRCLYEKPASAFLAAAAIIYTWFARHG